MWLDKKNILSNSKRNQIDDMKIQNLWHDSSLSNNNGGLKGLAKDDNNNGGLKGSRYNNKKNCFVCSITWPVVHREWP